MSKLEVLFHVPKYIELGLASGAFERVGGVIRESASKEVVAWLRDSGIIGSVTNLGSATPLGAIFNAAKAAVTLYDGVQTRRAISVLQDQVHNLTMLTGLTATGQIINLALTAASLRAILQRIDKLAEQVANLSEVIQAEFNRDRHMRFKTALQAARDVLESRNLGARNQRGSSAIDGLYEARENFFADFENLLSNHDLDYDALRMAQYHLLHAIYAETSRIRCYLEMEELALAKQRLGESMPGFEARTRRLVNLWLGEHPALFLYKEVASEDVDRFMQIQQWLRSADFSSTADALTMMFEIIDELRAEFWNSEIIRDRPNLIKQIRRQPYTTFSERLEKLPQCLTQAEIMIENYQRLLGFDLELRSMRLSVDHSFANWDRLISQDDIEQHGGFGLIVDQEAEAIQRLQTLQ